MTLVKIERCGAYGVVIETDKAVYICDYSNGTLPSQYLINSKPKMFLISRRDVNHYSKSIESYYFPIVASYDFSGMVKNHYRIMNPGDSLHVGYSKIRALASTRRGLIYVIEEDGMRILFGGDLNLWHWPDMYSEIQTQEAILRFYGVLHSLSKIGTYDLSFIAIDPIMRVDTDRSAREIVNVLKPKVFIPIGYKVREDVEPFYMWSKSQEHTEIVIADVGDAIHLKGINNGNNI